VGLYEHEYVHVKQFYQSINHNVAKEQIRRVIKCRHTLAMFDAVIDVHPQGLPIGSYTSQYLGNLVLSPIDHWAKEQARVKHYFRYIDDIVMILPTKAECHTMLAQLTQQLSALQLTVKNSWRIAPVTIGIDFIGYKFYPTHTRLRRRIKMRMLRTMRRLNKRNVSNSYFKRKTASHFGWCKHANCRNLLRKSLAHRYHIYAKHMQFKRLSELKEQQNWFALPKSSRVSIETLINTDIAFLDMIDITVKGESKIAVKFVHPHTPTEPQYFITRSDVMRDRLTRDKELMPFVAAVKRVKNYLAYE
jgi:hypothetical protein